MKNKTCFFEKNQDSVTSELVNYGDCLHEPFSVMRLGQRGNGYAIGLAAGGVDKLRIHAPGREYNADVPHFLRIWFGTGKDDEVALLHLIYFNLPSKMKKIL